MLELLYLGREHTTCREMGKIAVWVMMTTAPTRSMSVLPTVVTSGTYLTTFELAGG